MLRSMGSQRVGHDLVTEQQQCLREMLRERCVLLLQTPGSHSRQNGHGLWGGGRAQTLFCTSLQAG